MFRSYNPNDFIVLFYLKTTSAEHRKHKRFFKYIKPKLLKEIDKQATFHCDICNGTLSNEIKRLKERSGREILKYRKSNYEHLCTAKLEKKIFSLYFNVFDKIVESEPGLKKYANCDNLFFYAMTNFYKDEPDTLTPCMYPCVYCYGDPEEDNQDEINDNFKQEFQNLFL